MKIAGYVIAVILLYQGILFANTFSDKPTIAVLDFKTGNKPLIKQIHKSKEVTAITRDDKETNLFTAELITALVNTNKFTVVERDRLPTLVKEHAFDSSKEIPSEKIIKMGQILRAEYFVTGKIEVFEVSQKKAKTLYSKSKKPTFQGRMVVNMEIIDTRNGKIVAAKKVNTREVYREPAHGHTTLLAFIDMLKEKTVQQLVGGIIDGIFPTRIVKVSDNKVFLTNGLEGRVNVSDIMNVYNAGDELIDPDTLESLGMEEIQVGRIKITEIQPKYIIAQIIEGDAAHILAGAVCRLSEKPSENRLSEPKTPGSSSKPISW